jgi:hypothetical protein
MTLRAEVSEMSSAPARRPARADLRRGLRLLVAVKDAGLGPEIDKAVDRWINRLVPEIRALPDEAVSMEEARRLAG